MKLLFAERFGVTTVLAEVVLIPAGHVGGAGALRAGVHVHGDDSRLLAGSPDQGPRCGQVQQVRGPGVGRERHERDLDPVRRDQGDLAGQPGLGQAGRMDGLDGLGLATGAEVEGVVVGIVEDREPGLPEVPRVTRRIPEREAARAAPGAALAGRRCGERAFEVAEDELGPGPGWARPRRGRPPGPGAGPACSRASCRRRP